MCFLILFALALVAKAVGLPQAYTGPPLPGTPVDPLTSSTGDDIGHTTSRFYIWSTGTGPVTYYSGPQDTVTAVKNPGLTGCVKGYTTDYQNYCAIYKAGQRLCASVITIKPTTITKSNCDATTNTNSAMVTCLNDVASQVAQAGPAGGGAYSGPPTGV